MTRHSFDAFQVQLFLRTAACTLLLCFDAHSQLTMATRHAIMICIAALLVTLQVKSATTMATTDIAETNACPPRHAHPQHWTNGTCCSTCVPGTRVLELCTSQVGTQCRRCENGFYQDKENLEERCKRCRVCGRKMKAITNCTSSVDTRCNCVAGYKLVDSTAGPHCVKLDPVPVNNNGTDGLPKDYYETKQKVKDLTSLVHVLSAALSVVILVVVLMLVYISRHRARHPSKESAIRMLGTKELARLLGNDDPNFKCAAEFNLSAADSTVLLSTVSHLHKMKVAQLLTAGAGWEIIAAQVGYQTIDIQNWKVNQQEAAMNFLRDYETRNSTVLSLCQALNLHQRGDCVDILRGYIFPASRRPSFDACTPPATPLAAAADGVMV